MRHPLLITAILLTTVGVSGVAPEVGAAPGSRERAERSDVIDSLMTAALGDLGMARADRCSDEVFVRRVFLDVTGTLPDPREVRTFLRDDRPDKRARLIDDLLARPEFADYWSLKLCDLLRVKAEFPINLWPNAVQAYHRWILDSLRSNCPWDEFAFELLTSSGSNFRVPPVNFYRALQSREPSAIAEAVALTFMGARIDGWPEQRRAGMAAFFSRVAFKKTAEWKEEIVYPDPVQTDALEAVLPDGTPVRIDAGNDPRTVFAEWLVDPGNPWFATNIANRVWYWLMGRGLIHEPDDIRPDNPPTHPEVLAHLSSELIAAHYDLKHVFRLILDSEAYQQSSIPRAEIAAAEKVFACYPVRRLDAEVLIDALNGIFGSEAGYSSRIPEPYTFVPERQPTILLADGSTTSQFLEMFGRPPRDTGLESERDNRPTRAQRLFLLNSTHIQRMIEGSRWLRDLYRRAGGDGREVVAEMYLRILSRAPTTSETETALDYARDGGIDRRQAADDLAWALINTKEFLYRH